MSLVLDASSALSWIFERPDPDEAELAERLLDEITVYPIRVPSLWHLEIANALLIAERRRVASEAQVIDFLARLRPLPIIIHDAEVADRQEAIMALGRRHKLTAYDANYLDLALRTNSILATFDAKLAKAMRQAGGKVYGDPTPD